MGCAPSHKNVDPSKIKKCLSSSLFPQQRIAIYFTLGRSARRQHFPCPQSNRRPSCLSQTLMRRNNLLSWWEVGTEGITPSYHRQCSQGQHIHSFCPWQPSVMISPVVLIDNFIMFCCNGFVRSPQENSFLQRKIPHTHTDLGGNFPVRPFLRDTNAIQSLLHVETTLHYCIFVRPTPAPSGMRQPTAKRRSSPPPSLPPHSAPHRPFHSVLHVFTSHYSYIHMVKQPNIDKGRHRIRYLHTKIRASRQNRCTDHCCNFTFITSRCGVPAGIFAFTSA